MLKTIQAYISKHNLLTREGKHLVALSGGADSVALLLILKELGYNVDAMHCNFHLRGEESDRDENFCKENYIVCEFVRFHPMLSNWQPVENIYDIINDLESYEQYDLKPLLQESDNAFLVMLPNVNYKEIKG